MRLKGIFRISQFGKHCSRSNLKFGPIQTSDPSEMGRGCPSVLIIEPFLPVSDNRKTEKQKHKKTDGHNFLLNRVLGVLKHRENTKKKWGLEIFYSP
jgi:hypothetical protein